MSESRFTVYFEEPFWVGVYERVEEGTLRVCKITFGSEPREGDVYTFLLANWGRLAFSPPVPAEKRTMPCRNPKRRQRVIAKSLVPKGMGTKAQQTIKLAQQEGKKARKERRREEALARREKKRAQQVQKRKEKHKGH